MALVSGEVQQVGYRSRVLAAARALDIKGYVTNLPDGRVKIVAEGAKVDLDRFLRSVKIENTLINVTDISTEYSEPKGCYDSFYKITGEGETDARLDTAANYLKELIVAVREGFSSVNSKLDTIIAGQADLVDGQKCLAEKFESGMERLAERIEAGQERLTERIDASLENVAERLEAGQESLADKVEESGEKVASEVRGLRSDLEVRDDRLARLQGDVSEIKAKLAR